MRAPARTARLAAALLWCGVVGLTAQLPAVATTVPPPPVKTSTQRATSYPASPALRSVTKLCVGYAGCARAGMSSAGYDAARWTMYWQMYAGHNCTNYAAYRMVRSGLPNIRPWTGGGNATYWGSFMSRITNQTPAVGSVAWWKAGVYPAGSAGHVAYVEKVISSDEIIISQDSWGGDFSWARITRSSGGWPSGFIHFNDVAQTITSTAAPVVTGAARVGELLTATAGTWRPGDVRTSYQWRSRGVDIPGATAATLRVTPELLGHRVRVRVTATRPGASPVTARSARTPEVERGTLTASTAPTVTGDPRVGATLTAGAGTWSAAPDTTSFQWSADGIPLQGADRATLAVDAPLVGRSLTVTVTARKSGYLDGTATTPATAPVAPGTLTVTQRPDVTGASRTGATLTATPGSASPEAAGRIRWLRAGDPIPGARGTTYRLTPDDAGARVTARVRWTRPGYTPLRVRATPTARVRLVR